MPRPSIAQLLVEATRILRRAAIPDARRDAATLLANLIACDAAYLIAHAEKEVTLSDIARYRGFVERRATGEPVQYIVGHQEFFNLDFLVTHDVLIPRPETELLVETALNLIPEKEEHLICDVGTGSGCIAISILHERANARCVALDSSLKALSITASNAMRHSLRDRLLLLASDCFAALSSLQARFHMIVSNPPYVAEETFAGLGREVRDHEPRAALTSGDDGLSMIRRLLVDAPGFLMPHGHLLIEIGFDQNQAVTEMIDEGVWTLLGIHKDLQGIPRTVVVKKKGEEQGEMSEVRC
jgi:release factor glutamine methyltransferase